MLKKATFLLAVLAVCVSGPVRAATIVWVSEWMAAGGVPYDQGWIDLLRAQGYTVEADTASNYGVLDASHLAALEAADLIIVSRTTNSSGYATDAAEVTQWNSVATPLITMNAFFPRSNRWLWVDSTSVNELAEETLMEVVQASHPVFEGVSIAGNQVDVIDAAVNSGQSTFVTAADVGNGTLIAKRADDGSLWIAEWAPGVPFYATSTEQPAAKRMLLSGGGGGGQTAGSMNFTPDGQRIFLNAVAYMAGVSLNPGVATLVGPQDGQTGVAQDGVLTWTPGRWAAGHDVYFGTDFNDVNDATRGDPRGVLLSQGQTGHTFDPDGLLAFGQTYFWRVDEVNAPHDNSIHRGQTWEFMVEPYSYPVTPASAEASSSFNANTRPVKTIDGSGLTQDGHSTNLAHMWFSGKTPQPAWIRYEFDQVHKLDQMWVWNSNQGTEPTNGFGARDVAITTSTDGTTWTTLEDVPEFAQAPGKAGYAHNTTVDFGGVLAKCVQLTINSNWGSPTKQTGLSEVRFFHAPLYASDPQPADGATDVALGSLLHWRPGREAAQHEVSFGTDRDAVLSGTAPVQTVAGNQVALTALGGEYDRTYYWRVNEVNDAAVMKVWPGEVWSLSTAEYGVVDDFEAYDDDCRRVFFTWLGGAADSGSLACGRAPYAGNGTGSAVGNDAPPYADRAVVHGGKQSMPFFYDNTAGATVSEAVRTFDGPQDWTQGGVRTLVLFFHGDPANGAGQFYVKINNARVDYGGSAEALARSLWMQWNIDLSSVAGLQTVHSLTVGVSGAVRGRLCIDDIRLYRVAPPVPVPADPGATGLVAHYAFEGDVRDASGGNRHGTALEGPAYMDSQPGLGQAMRFDGVNDHVELPIGDLVGTLTSATVATWVNFDLTSTGSWQRIFDFGTDPNTAYMFLTPRQGTTGTMRFAITKTGNTAESTASSTLPFTAGWHHVAVVIEGPTKTLQLCFDGEVVAGGPTESLPADLGNTTRNWLGRSQFDADGYFGGALDEFRIYNRALSVGEVRYLAGDR